MPNQASFTAATPGAVVQGTVTDKLPMLPGTPPTGRTAIGPRITPNFITDPWSSDNTYQYYDVVLVEGASYIARKAVPAGIQITNTEYWIHWADPNAQFAELQNTVQTFDERITENADAIATNVEDIDKNTEDIATNTAAIATNTAVIAPESNPIYYGADPTGAEDSTEAINACLTANAGKEVTFTPGTYLISSPIATDYLQRTAIDFNGSVIICNASSAIDCALGIGYLNYENNIESGSNANLGNYPPSTFANGTIVTNANVSYAVAVKAHYMNANITNMFINTKTNGIQLADQAGYPIDGRIDGCFIWNTAAAPTNMVGVDATNGTDSTITNTRVYNFNSYIIVSGGEKINNIHLLGITQNSLNGIGFVATNGFILMDNIYIDTIQTGVALRSNDVRILCGNFATFFYKEVSNPVGFDTIGSNIAGALIDINNYFVNTTNIPANTYKSIATSNMRLLTYQFKIAHTLVGGAEEPIYEFDPLFQNINNSGNATYSIEANTWSLLARIIIGNNKFVRVLYSTNNTLNSVNIFNTSGTIELTADNIKGATNMQYGVNVVTNTNNNLFIELYINQPITNIPNGKAFYDIETLVLNPIFYPGSVKTLTSAPQYTVTPS